MGKSRRTINLEKAAEEFPAIYPFGTDLTDFLTADEERTAPFAERLRSSWRYLAGRVSRFSGTLSEKERSVFDIQDIIQSVVEKLLEKDHLWDPDRGRYSTFAESVMMSVLSGCHEQARTVTGPTNSYARLRKYNERLASGTITSSMRRTMDRLERVMGDFESLDNEGLIPEREDNCEEVVHLRQAMKYLSDPLYAWTLARRYGLFGLQEMTIKEIASQLRMEERTVKRTIKEARAEVREWIIHHNEDTSELNGKW